LTGSVQRAEDRLLDQLTAPAIAGRYGFGAHELPGQVPRRQRLRGVAQFVMDPPKTLALAEPGPSCPLSFGTDLLRPDFGIEQRIVAAKCARFVRCRVSCCSSWLTIPANSARLLRNALTTCSSAMPALSRNNEDQDSKSQSRRRELGRGDAFERSRLGN
jgi:hypothetical protein